MQKKFNFKLYVPHPQDIPYLNQPFPRISGVPIGCSVVVASCAISYGIIPSTSPEDTCRPPRDPILLCRDAGKKLCVPISEITKFYCLKSIIDCLR